MLVALVIAAVGLALAALAWRRVSTLQVDLAQEATRAESLEESLAAARVETDRERAERLEAEKAMKDLQELRSDIVEARKQSEETQREAVEARKSVEEGTDKSREMLDRLLSRYTRPKGRGQLSEQWIAGILEGFGLREGVNYEREHRVAIEKPNGETSIGVIDYYLRLPGASGIALDAKYPFVRAEDLVSDNDIVRKKAHDTLRSSLRAHIKGLAERRYQDAKDCRVNAVFLVLPSWEDHALARRVAPDLWEYAQQLRVSIVPADGVFEIAEAVGLVHRLADTAGKISRLHDPVAVGKMFDASLAMLDGLIRAVESHNAHGNHLGSVVKSLAANGKFRRDVLDVLADAANRPGDDRQLGEVRELPVDRAVRHRKHLAEKAEGLSGEASA